MDTPKYDRELVGTVVRRELNRRYGSVSAFTAQVGLGRKTVERVLAGDDKVTFATLQRVEGALDLPRDTLLFVGEHDLESLAELGVDPDLIRWIGRELGHEDPSRQAR